MEVSLPDSTVGRPEQSREAGFTLVETSIAVLVSIVGLAGLLALLTVSLVTLTISQDELIAKQKTREALESIYTARNTQQLVFDDIRNEAGGGIFLSGFQPLRRPNPQGLVGTATDGELEEMILPGPDDTMGTDDDEIRSLERFERQIEILPIGGTNDLRELTVTVRYTSVQGSLQVYRVQSYISRFR